MAEPNHKSRAHALLSASSAHRWLNCPPSAVAAEAYANEDTEYTPEGTRAHEVAEICASFLGKDVKPQPDPAKGYDQEMIDCGLAWRDYIQEQTKTADAVILLEQRVDFSPWVPNGFGTCDAIILQDDTLIVADYKYGVGVPVSAIDNPQARLYALGALNDYGFVYDIEKVETHIFQPRLNSISVDKLTADELYAWAETIKPIAQNAAKGKGEYSAGSWCKFCPHAGSCRKLTETCQQYVSTHGLRVAVPVLAPHEVADVLAMEPLITLWLKRVRSQALDTMLDGKNIPGYKVVEGRGSRDWTDEIRVAERLRAADFASEAYLKTELLSPAALEKSIGKKRVSELLVDLIDKKAGAPTIAPETDKRPVYNRADDFENLED